MPIFGVVYGWVWLYEQIEEEEEEEPYVAKRSDYVLQMRYQLKMQ